jgi:two-component system cell cycle sensor histidine kinase/response regulator CckA
MDASAPRPPHRAWLPRSLPAGALLAIAATATVAGAALYPRPVPAWGAALAAAALGAVTLVASWRRTAAPLPPPAGMSQVLEQANDPILVVDKQGRILDANRRAAEFYGYAHAALLQRTVFDLRVPSGHADARARLSASNFRYESVFEAEHQRADGSSVLVEVSLRQVELESGPAFVSVVRDLSDRLRSSSRAARLAQLQVLRAHVNERLARGDSATALLDATCRLAVAEGGLRLAWVGLADPDGSVRVAASAGEASTYPHTITVRWDDGPLAGGPTGRCIREGRSCVVQIDEAGFSPWRDAALAADVHSTAAVPIRAGDHVAGALCVYGDRYLNFDADFVTVLESVGGDIGFALQAIEEREARRAAQEALTSSEARFRAIFDQSPIGIAIGSLEGRLDRVNPALQRLLGYTEQELRRMTFAGVTFPEDLPKELPLLQALAAGERDTYSLEKRYVRKDARIVWGDVTVARVTDPSTQLDFGLGLVRDISDRKVLQEELIQAQKMEGIGRLAGGVAHDFNNLLTAILGYGEVVSSELGEGHPAQSFLAEIQKAGTRAAALTAQLLAFARRQVVAPRILNLNDIVEDAGRLLQRLVGEHVRIETRLAPDLWLVEADANQMQQVLVNMVVNARDAMPNGGRVLISTANDVIAPASGSGPGRDHIRLSVADTGVGMDPDALEHVFEPFFTTKEQGKGTGLGLATCHGIVTQSGGSIHVASRPGHGARFDILLPRALGRRSAPLEEIRPRAAEGRGETVLVVEDEPAVRALAAHALTNRGYRVLQAENGEAALRLAREQAGGIQLLVTDVIMPGMNGAVLAAALRQVCPGTPVLFVSGHADSVIAPGGVPDPAVEYLSKPFTPEQFAARVRDVIDRA